MSILQLSTHDIIQSWTIAMVHSLWIGLGIAFVYYVYLDRYAHHTASTKYKAGIGLISILPLSVGIAFIQAMPKRSFDVLHNSRLNASYVLNTAGDSFSSVLTKNQSLIDRILVHDQLICTLWFVGVLMCMVRLMIGYREVYRLKTSFVHIDDESIIHLVRPLMDKVGIHKKIRIGLTGLSEMPLTLGHLKPMILLPISIVNRLTPDETYAIIAHEIGHILRNDYLHNLFISFSEIFFFFHPSVWWMSSTIKNLREEACDDIAITLGASRMALSKALVSIEESSPNPILAMAFNRKNQLLHRVQRLFDPSFKSNITMSKSQAPILAVSLVFLFFLGRPIVNLGAEKIGIPLLNTFIWDKTVSQPDTTKPKSKIEKISKDDGKRKIEMQLKDKQIDELKVNDKIIPKSDYNKYETETEALKKELNEIDLPDRQPRGKVYRDFDDEDGLVRVFPRGSGRTFVSPDQNGNLFYYDGKGKGKGNGHSYSYGWSGSDRPNVIIKGDTSDIEFDGDHMILKGDKGDIIIDIPGRSRAFSMPGFDMKGFEFPDNFHMPDMSKIRIPKFDMPGQSFSFVYPKFEMEDSMNWQKWSDEMKENGERWSKEWKENARKWKENWKENADKMRDEWKDNQNKWRDDMREGQLRSRELYDHARKQNRELLEEKRHLKSKLDDEFQHRKHFDTRTDEFGEELGLPREPVNMNDLVKDQLTEEHIISKGEKFNFKISARELRVNGKKQSDEVFNRYKKMIKDRTGMDVKGGTILELEGN